MTTSTEVPGRFPVAINGRPYMIDPAGFRRTTVPVLREQSDTSGLPSESSLDRRGLWLRSQESWHHGAGQKLFDGKESGTAADPERYDTSSGIDVWTRGEISLLRETIFIKDTPLAEIEHMVTVGNHVYFAESAKVWWANDPTAAPSTWTDANIAAGQVVGTVSSLATDGHYIWATLGTSGLHRTTRGATSSTADVPADSCQLVGYAMGRLLIAWANEIFEVVNPISAPAAVSLYAHFDTDFRWSFISPGRNVIYVGGNNNNGIFDSVTDTFIGGNGEVYKITLNPTDGSLTAPSPATYLPDGESIYNVIFYAGGIVMATSRGLRLGVADGAGNIDYGPLVEIDRPVMALEPQSRYLWFTGDNQGLYRADLGFFTDPLTPAYAPDVEINPADVDLGSSKAAGSLTEGGSPVFTWHVGTVTGDNPRGVYRTSSDTLVATGTLTTGQIRFGTSVPKLLRAVEIKHKPLPAGASIQVEYRADDGTWTSMGTNSTADSSTVTFTIAPVAFEFVELRFTLTRGTDTTTGPTLLRWTLKALPTPDRRYTYILPLILRSQVTDLGEHVSLVDVESELDALQTLEDDGTVFEFQVGNDTLTGYIENSEQQGEHWSETGNPHRFLEGTLVLQVTEV